MGLKAVFALASLSTAYGAFALAVPEPLIGGCSGIVAVGLAGLALHETVAYVRERNLGHHKPKVS